MKYIIRNLIRNFKQGVINIYIYLPIIWKDRNWDYSYIDDILLLKLERTYKVFINSFISPLPENTGHWKSVKGLKICINILKRRQNNWYYNTFSKLYTGTEIDILRQKDWKIFCNIFQKYYDFWWD